MESRPSRSYKFDKELALHKNFETAELDNAAISELCAREAEHVSSHLQQAFRRAARKALLWSEEARDLVFAGRSLSELDGIGPSLVRRIHKWMDEPLDIVDRPPIRQEFLTLTQARRALSRHPKWQAMVRSDLQMHTVWSDGSATAAEMAHVAIDRGYKLYSDHRPYKGTQNRQRPRRADSSYTRGVRSTRLIKSLRTAAPALSF
jgi:hypothetical protein